MRYKIALDCDDVLNNLSEMTIKMFNDENGTNYSVDTFLYYDIYKCMPFEDAEKYRALWQRKDLWDSLSPVDGAQRGVKKLIDIGYDVYITTATHWENFPWKVEWMQKFFPYLDESRIVCVCDKSILAVDVMVDDNADNLIGNIRCNRVLFDKPWNRSVRDDVYDIVRCCDWDEIVDAINNFYKNDIELVDSFLL